MFAFSRPIVLVAALLLIPAGFAFADSGHTATAMSGQNAGSFKAGLTGDPTNPNVRGATGRVIVPGSNSTVAGDAAASEMQRTGSIVPSD